MQSFDTTAGRPSCSIVNSLLGICRNTIETLPRCLKIDTRKRAMSPKAKPKSEPADRLQLLLAAVRRDALHQRHRVVGREHLRLQPAQVTVKTEHRRLTDA